jgi:hypothetical protein
MTPSRQYATGQVADLALDNYGRPNNFGPTGSPLASNKVFSGGEWNFEVYNRNKGLNNSELPR